MAEKVARTHIARDNAFMYFIKKGDVWRVPRREPGQPKAKAEKVATAGIEMDYERYIYFLDGDGDVARQPRQVGGAKRRAVVKNAPGTKPTPASAEVRGTRRSGRRVITPDSRQVYTKKKPPKKKRKRNEPEAGLGHVAPTAQIARASRFITDEAAERLEFAELARVLRAALPASDEERARFLELLGVLERKAEALQPNLEPSNAATSARIIRNLRRDLDTPAALPSPTKIEWSFFPPGDTGRARVLATLGDLQRRRPDVRYDKSRLEFAYSLEPRVEQVYVGSGAGSDYFAFVFAGGTAVLLENPLDGNAAYVFGSEWRLLSRLSKSELIDEHKGDVVRIVHVGAATSWKKQIRKALRKMANRKVTSSS